MSDENPVRRSRIVAALFELLIPGWGSRFGMRRRCRASSSGSNVGLFDDRLSCDGRAVVWLRGWARCEHGHLVPHRVALEAVGSTPALD